MRNMYPLKREVRFVADHLPIIAITNLTILNENALYSFLSLLSTANSVGRGGESRGCLSFEFNASFAIFYARESSMSEGLALPGEACKL